MLFVWSFHICKNLSQFKFLSTSQDGLENIQGVLAGCGDMRGCVCNIIVHLCVYRHLKRAGLLTASYMCVYVCVCGPEAHGPGPFATRQHTWSQQNDRGDDQRADDQNNKQCNRYSLPVPLRRVTSHQLLQKETDKERESMWVDECKWEVSQGQLCVSEQRLLGNCCWPKTISATISVQKSKCNLMWHTVLFKSLGMGRSFAQQGCI